MRELDPHIAAPSARDAALAVELALEQPVPTEVATVGQGRQHEVNWHTGIVPLLRHVGHSPGFKNSERALGACNATAPR